MVLPGGRMAFKNGTGIKQFEKKMKEDYPDIERVKQVFFGL